MDAFAFPGEDLDLVESHRLALGAGCRTDFESDVSGEFVKGNQDVPFGVVEVPCGAGQRALGGTTFSSSDGAWS